MFSSAKVFIYNGVGVSEESADDLKELFTSREIFPQGVDVQMTPSFYLNMRQARHATFVVPAGEAFKISVPLRPSLLRIKRELGVDFNYVGVCSGAFIGLDNADVFHTIEPLENLHHQPKFFIELNPQFNTGMVTEYTGLGPYLPNDDYVGKTAQAFIPYRVNLTLVQQTQTLPQLYVDGPGFIPANSNTQTTLKPLTTFTRPNGFSFFKEDIHTSVPTLTTMIASTADANRGARFLSSTHIESCVANSKFLNIFKTSGNLWEALSDQDYNAFINEQETTKTTVVKLLHETLKPR